MSYPETTVNGVSVSSELYDDLVFYFRYASSAYITVCPRPNGKHLCMQFSSPVSDSIQGFVARDSDRKEIVVSIRGSASITDLTLDALIVLVPLISPGIFAPSGTLVHSGFLTAWNSVCVQVIAIVAEELATHPGYSIVTTGHSLGGALSLLAAVSLRLNFPDVMTRTYSYGAPRTGNTTFSKFVNELFGQKAFRVVHANDGVPTVIPTSLGYHHHGIEYWQHADPACPASIVQCSADGEDPTCSASIPSQGVNGAHLKYFGIIAGTPFCL